MDNIENILEQYKPLFVYMAKKCGIYEMFEFEEMLQEGSLALWETILNYDDKKSSFNTFLTIKLEKHFLNLRRSKKRLKNNYTQVSLDKELNNDTESNLQLSDLIALDIDNFENIFIRDYIKQMINNNELSETEKKVFYYVLYYRMQGYKSVAKIITEKHGIRRKKIDNALTRIKRKIPLKELYANNSYKDIDKQRGIIAWARSGL